MEIDGIGDQIQKQSWMGKRKTSRSHENDVFFVASGQCGLYSGLLPPSPRMISLKWDILIRGLERVVWLHS